MPLREYVDSLDGVAKSRYFDKLKAFGLAATDNPERHATGVACRVWPHFLLLHRAPWSLHTIGAAPMKAHTTISRVDSSGPWRCRISGTAAGTGLSGTCLVKG